VANSRLAFASADRRISVNLRRKGFKMTYDQLKQLIHESSKGDWLFSDERGIYTFKNDLNLRIQRNPIDHVLDKFTGEDWATNHPDPVAYRVTYEIYYGASFVEYQLMVSVDGHRATLPLPDRSTQKVTADSYRFAQIVDQLNTLDEYMHRAKLEVES
jgi:hypothetical protein